MPEVLDILAQQSHNPDFASDIDIEQLKIVLQDKDPKSQMQYILEHLAAGPGKCTFEKVEPFEGEIDLSSLPLEKRDQTMVSDAVRIFQDYCALPIITDGFDGIAESITEGTGRRGWRDRMQKQFPDVFKSVYGENKLRFGKIQELQTSVNNIEFVLMFYPEDQALAGLLQANQKLKTELFGLVPSAEEYASFKLDNKVAKVKAIDQAVRTFLTELSRQTQVAHSTL